nr:metal ABC transporter permease [Prevotella sp.]
MLDILQYSFFRNALLGSLLASILCGFIGTYIVTHRLVFISGGITHASFGGIGLGVLLGANPIISAMIFAVLSACGVQWMSHKSDIREDSAIAVFWTFGMSIGIICCFLSPGFMPDLPSILFGNILTIGMSDIIILAVVALFTTIIFTFFIHQIQSVAFDNIFARSQRLPVDFIEYGMMALTAITIVSTLRMVGIVLAISLLTIPQMTANLLTFSYKKIIILSIIIGCIDCICGLMISFWLNVPSGASIIFVSIIIYALIKTIKVVSLLLYNREVH